MEFNELEREALKALCSYWKDKYPALTKQVEAVRCVQRENTGGGFFTELHVDQNVIPRLTGSSPINGHYVRVAGMKYDIGLILFFKDGYLNLLEGYSVGGENTSNIDFSRDRFGKITWKPEQFVT
ncbi:MAG: hypothetical protein ACJA06_001501 [Halocynthiibacter sp.]|jgi:hypothetical protein